MFAQEFSITVPHSIDFIESVLGRYLLNDELFVNFMGDWFEDELLQVFNEVKTE